MASRLPTAKTGFFHLSAPTPCCRVLLVLAARHAAENALLFFSGRMISSLPSHPKLCFVDSLLPSPCPEPIPYICHSPISPLTLILVELARVHRLEDNTSRHSSDSPHILHRRPPVSPGTLLFARMAHIPARARPSNLVPPCLFQPPLSAHLPSPVRPGYQYVQIVCNGADKHTSRPSC